jgi:hypothetical protein
VTTNLDFSMEFLVNLGEENQSFVCPSRCLMAFLAFGQAQIARFLAAKDNSDVGFR